MDKTSKCSMVHPRSELHPYRITTTAPPGTIAQPAPLLRVEEAAAFLGHAIATLNNWRAAGTGPRFVKFGRGSVRYRLEDLAGFVEARLVASTSQRTKV